MIDPIRFEYGIEDLRWNKRRLTKGLHLSHTIFVVSPDIDEETLAPNSIWHEGEANSLFIY